MMKTPRISYNFPGDQFCVRICVPGLVGEWLPACQRLSAAMAGRSSGLLHRYMRCGRESNPRIDVLQTSAFPLRHRTKACISYHELAFRQNDMVKYNSLGV